MGFPEPDSDIAIRLRMQFILDVDKLLAPDIFPIECAHALRKAEWQKRVPKGDAKKALFAILGTAPRLAKSSLLRPRAMDLSEQYRRGIYDCLYLALAEEENCELVTADTKLHGLPNVRELSNIP